MFLSKIKCFIKVNILRKEDSKKADLKDIIKKENKYTSNAKFDLGDNYLLTLDLLKLIQSIKKFDLDKNKLAFYFETQILKDFHIIVLNVIRRHYVVATIILRHALESLSLFIYSMEHNDETEYIKTRKNNEIVEFNEKIKNKANNFFEKKYPEESKFIKGCKNVINAFYSHANIFSSQYNTIIINDRIKSSIFDPYPDEAIINFLNHINETMCMILEIYKKLQNEYGSFYFEDGFEEKLKECKNIQNRLKADIIRRYEEMPIYRFPEVEKIISNLDK